jgi:hypothetical protein
LDVTLEIKNNGEDKPIFINANVCVITEADVTDMEDEPPLNNKLLAIPFI